MGISKIKKRVDNLNTLLPFYQYSMIRELKTDITLTSDASINNEEIQVSAGHGFSVDEVLVLFENNVTDYLIVSSVVDNTIGFDLPLGNNYTVAGCQITRGDKRLNINAGAGVDVLFRPRSSVIPIDISGARIVMQHLQAGDDGKFGGIAALDPGIYIRRYLAGRVFNLGLYKTNLDFKLLGAEVNYQAKGPGGTESTEIIWDFKKIFSNSIRTFTRLGDYVLLRLRGDLTGLNLLEVSLLGNFTEG